MYVLGKRRCLATCAVFSVIGLACLLLALQFPGLAGVQAEEQPVHEMIGQAEVVYQNIPQPKGVLLLLHGCRHAAPDWFPQSPTCPTCLGLPEEVRISRSAAAAGLVPLAVSSQDRLQDKCWHFAWPPEDSVDVAPVMEAVRLLQERHRWARLPRYALGASSGGAMALLLAQRLKLQGLCSQIAGVPEESLGGPHDAEGRTWPVPSSVFVHMERDWRTAAVVRSNIKKLRSKGVHVKEILASPLPVTGTFLADRIEGISLQASHAAYALLKADGFLSTDDDTLVQDPRRSNWQRAVKTLARTHNWPLEPDRSPVHEELNRAWAGHEVVSDYMEETLAFWGLSTKR